MSRFKMAQRRSMLDKFKQNFDIGTKALSLFDRQFREFFEMLQEADESARQEAAKLTPFKKGAEAHFENKNYLGAAEQLGRFYDTLGAINGMFKKIEMTLEKQNYSILVDHLDEDVKRYLHEQIQSTARARLPELTKNAGLFDWLKDSIYTRRRAINALEKKFTRFKELRNGLDKEVRQLDKVFVDVIKIFKVLSAAIAKGDISVYERNIKLFEQVYVANNARFRKFFVQNVKPFGEYLKRQLEGPATVVPGNELGKSTNNSLPSSGYAGLSPSEFSGMKAPAQPALVPTPKLLDPVKSPQDTSFVPTVMPAEKTQAPVVFPFNSSPAKAVTPPAPSPATINSGKRHNPAAKPKRLKNPPPIDMTDEALEADDQDFDAYASNNHGEFINKLATMKDKSLSALANEILEYSESLEDTDPDASLRLLAIVEGIL